MRFIKFDNHKDKIKIIRRERSQGRIAEAKGKAVYSYTREEYTREQALKELER